jgi:alpha-amylase/alpha-mannosidase (GH57 family)
VTGQPPRYVCIHGHFYQPPRENPWLEAIERQDSAQPYHDWNERITAECYGPNALSRILDGDRIVRIVNNYARISFNCGPTLLSWMEAQAPEVYRAIRDADRDSAAAFGGHGSAMAQPYNHMIMPLASRRDQVTQVRWGLHDFRRRFGREPEGMWLPETAADVPTLEVLAEHGIRFTVLAPSQAARTRRRGEEAWEEIDGGSVDPTRPYEVVLPSGRTIAVFFYDGPISRAVAFERLLHRGEDLAGRLRGGFSDAREWPQLVHIATDGETYGHHHRFGDMALAYALHALGTSGDVELTNYGQYLERHPPTHQAEIRENTSWSCVHGLERWRSDCGCNTGREGWRQAWRAPLREALDLLRDELAAPFERHLAPLLEDPWRARDEYAAVVLDRSPEARERFLAEHARGDLPAAEAVCTWRLLEMQRHLMLMYTSCGWFFDDLSGIETVQVLQYAARALQLAREALGLDLEEQFLRRLEAARSNLPEQGSGRDVWAKLVKPAAVDLLRVGGHYAISSLFHKQGSRVRVYCYGVERLEHRALRAGEARLATGWTSVTSELTGESEPVTYGVLHWGDHNVNGGVRPFQGETAYRQMETEVGEAFGQADFPQVVRLLDKHFGTSTYSLRTLFADERRAVLEQVLHDSVVDAEGDYRQMYERRAPLMRFLTSLGMPLPPAFRAAAEMVLNAYLREALESFEPEPLRVRDLMEHARLEGVPLDAGAHGFTLSRTIRRLSDAHQGRPADLPALIRLESCVRLARALPFELDLWPAQNGYHMVRESSLAEMRERARAGDEPAEKWLGHFLALGDLLLFKRPEGL